MRGPILEHDFRNRIEVASQVVTAVSAKSSGPPPSTLLLLDHDQRNHMINGSRLICRAQHG